MTLTEGPVLLSSLMPGLWVYILQDSMAYEKLDVGIRRKVKKGGVAPRDCLRKRSQANLYDSMSVISEQMFATAELCSKVYDVFPGR